MNTKSKALERVKFFKKDEKEGIEHYKKAIKVAKGKERDTYKKILPQEKKHLQDIKKI